MPRHPVSLTRPALLVTLLAVLALGACQPAGAQPPANPVTLRFTYWGSAVEKEAIARMVRSFEAANPDIRVDARHFASSEYAAQVQGLLGSDTPPDIGYLFETHAAQWASDGKVLDLTDIIQADPALSARLPDSFYYFAPGRTLGTSTATEIMVLFYNKELFEKAGLPFPPSRPEAAWTWPEFLTVARRLTVDAAGRHPGDAGFDPEQIVRYGVSFDLRDWYGYLPFIYSNGGDVVDDSGTHLRLDEPEAVEAVQKLADLMWVEHVMPTPQQQANLPSSDVLLQTGQLAMDLRGQWKLMDFASMEGLDFGLGVLPKLKEPKTILLGSPTVIFAQTPHLDAAVRFYKFHDDPQAVDLYARGLWMPLDRAYYTDPKAIASWLDNPSHPPESRDVLVSYTLCCAVRTPFVYVRNFGAVTAEIIQPAVEQVWNSRVPAQAALRQAAQDAEPLLSGRWDR
jgi:multiple sugar transport system substrate-binding protein